MFREVLDVVSEIESPFLDAQDQANVLSRSMCDVDEQMDVETDKGGGGGDATKKVNTSRGEEPIEVVQARVQITLLREKIDNLVASQQFLLAQEAKSEMDRQQDIVVRYEESKKKQEQCFLAQDDGDDFEKSFERELEKEQHKEFKVSLFLRGFGHIYIRGLRIFVEVSSGNSNS